MENIPPQAIITDQCPSIGRAVKIVFPEARHRWCLWHIVSKFPEKFKQYNMYYDIKDYFLSLVYDSVSIEEFEIGWANMVHLFDLEGHAWLNDLFEGREKWAPIYVKRGFWGGMSATQRSEGMNAFFDGYIHSRSTLKQFVDQYETALMDKMEKEMAADATCVNTSMQPWTDYAIEKQFELAYTHGIYQLVRNEFKKMIYCTISLYDEKENVKVYSVDCKIYIEVNYWKRVIYDVTFNTSTVDVTCNCLLFESKGILCSHSLCVLTKHDVESLPERYILRRWRKDVKRKHSKTKLCLLSPQYSTEAKRVKEAEEIFSQACNIACENRAMFAHMCRELKGILRTLEAWDSEGNPSVSFHDADAGEGSQLDDNDRSVTDRIDGPYSDPLTTTRRGRPKEKRVTSRMEKQSKKKSDNTVKRKNKKTQRKHLTNQNTTYRVVSERNGETVDLTEGVTLASESSFATNWEPTQMSHVNVGMVDFLTRHNGS